MESSECEWAFHACRCLKGLQGVEPFGGRNPGRPDVGVVHGIAGLFGLAFAPQLAHPGASRVEVAGALPYAPAPSSLPLGDRPFLRHFRSLSGCSDIVGLVWITVCEECACTSTQYMCFFFFFYSSSSLSFLFLLGGGLQLR